MRTAEQITDSMLNCGWPECEDAGKRWHLHIVDNPVDELARIQDLIANYVPPDNVTACCKGEILASAQHRDLVDFQTGTFCSVCKQWNPEVIARESL